MMKLHVDREKCIKAGECYYNHPALFEMEEDGYPRIRVISISSESERVEAEQAIEVCPAVAISLSD